MRKVRASCAALIPSQMLSTLTIHADRLLIGALLASNGRMRAYYLAADALGTWLTAWAFRPLALRLGRRRRVARNSRETGETEPKGF